MEERKVTLENITDEDIIAMAKTIQQYEEIIKAQKGYIIQLQTQLSQRSQQVAQMKREQNDTTTFITVDAKLDL